MRAIGVLVVLDVVAKNATLFKITRACKFVVTIQIDPPLSFTHLRTKVIRILYADKWKVICLINLYRMSS